MTRSRLILAGAVVLALAGSFAAGRHHGPERIKDVYKTDVVYKDRIVEKVVHDVQTVHDVATQTRTVTVTRWAKAPDGSPVVTQETHAERDQQAETKRQTRTQGMQERIAEGKQTVVELHTVEARPRLSLGVLAGLQRGGGSLISAVPAPLVLGGEATYRVAGPVHAGAWGLFGRRDDGKVTAAGGLSLRVDW